MEEMAARLQAKFQQEEEEVKTGVRTTNIGEDELEEELPAPKKPESTMEMLMSIGPVLDEKDMLEKIKAMRKGRRKKKRRGKKAAKEGEEGDEEEEGGDDEEAAGEEKEEKKEAGGEEKEEKKEAVEETKKEEEKTE